MVKINQTNWVDTEKRSPQIERSAIKVGQDNWGGIGGILEPAIIRQFKGINSLDPFSIADEMMVMNKNISTASYPAAKVREGFTVINTTVGATESLGAWKETELHRIGGGSWSRYTGTGWQNLASALSPFKKWSFTNFKGNFADINLIGANGVDPVKVYDGTTVANLTNAPVGMNYVVTHENRVYGAVKNALHYSGLRLATDWTTVDQSGQLVIENNSGEDITSVFNGTGKIMVFMSHSMHELYGTGPKNYQLQIISDEIGCVTHQSVVNIGGRTIFLGNDGLYEYSGGTMPSKDFSIAVQAIFDRINVAALDKVVAGTDNSRYYISIPIDGATMPNITIEFDPKFETWNVWDFGYTPTAYGVIGETMYVGFAEGRVVKMGTSEDETNQIPYSLETKPFSYGSLAAKNRLYRLWIVADIPMEASMDIFISNEKSGDNWTLVKTVIANDLYSLALRVLEGEGSGINKQILVPVDQSFHHHWVRIKIEGEGAVTIHEITRQERTFQMGI